MRSTARDRPTGLDRRNYCPGDVTASADLNHFVFATEWNVFAPGGQLTAARLRLRQRHRHDGPSPIASKTPSGDDIPSEPGDASGDPLQIPAVSADGSHILMAAGGTGPCGAGQMPAAALRRDRYVRSAARCSPATST